MNVNRRLRKKAVQTPDVGYGLLGLLVLLYLFYQSISVPIKEWNVSQELSQNGRWTWAEVVSFSPKVGNEKPPEITYEYSVPDTAGKTRTYTGEANVSYSEGTRLHTIYSSRQPTISRIAERYVNRDNFFSDYIFSDDNTPNFWLSGILFIPVIMIVMLARGVKEARWASLLDQQGNLTSATVLPRDPKQEKDDEEYIVRYQYLVMGQTYQLKEKVTKETLDQMPEGSRVQVQYLPDRPDVARLVLRK